MKLEAVWMKPWYKDKELGEVKTRKKYNTLFTLNHDNIRY